MSGWIAVKRGTLEHELFAPAGPWSRYEAWCWMIESAAYKPTVIDLGGVPHTVPRGSMCFSIRFLAAKWKWSPKAVRTFLDRLQAHNAIAVSVSKGGNGKGTARTQISLCNYEKYQSAGQAKGTAGAQQGHKEEQGNNIPVGEGADAPRDLTSIVFTEGRKILGDAGVKQRQAGTLLGKWRKAHGDEAVIAALARAQREGAIDPVSFIEGCFRFNRQQGREERAGYTNAGAFGMIPEVC